MLKNPSGMTIGVLFLSSCLNERWGTVRRAPTVAVWSEQERVSEQLLESEAEVQPIIAIAKAGTAMGVLILQSEVKV